MPAPGGYWLPLPAMIASAAARAISAGPSVSGKPWPRLTEPVETASSDISAKIVVPRPASLRFSSGRFIWLSDHDLHLASTSIAPPLHTACVLIGRRSRSARVSLGGLPAQGEHGGLARATTKNGTSVLGGVHESEPQRVARAHHRGWSWRGGRGGPPPSLPHRTPPPRA